MSKWEIVAKGGTDYVFFSNSESVGVYCIPADLAEATLELWNEPEPAPEPTERVLARSGDERVIERDGELISQYMTSRGWTNRGGNFAKIICDVTRQREELVKAGSELMIVGDDFCAARWNAAVAATKVEEEVMGK